MEESETTGQKTSLETEMENYLKEELGRNQPLDLSVPKNSPIPTITVTGEEEETAGEAAAAGDVAACSPSSHQLDGGDASGHNQPTALPHSEQSNPAQPEKEVNGAADAEIIDVDKDRNSDVVGGDGVVRATLTLSRSPQGVSRIPSRKSSAPQQPPQLCSGEGGGSGEVASLSEDLRKLEFRLERFLSKTCSEAGSETSETSDVSMRSAGSSNNSSNTTTTMSSLVNRLHNAQTATTRAKAAEIQQKNVMTSSTISNGGNISSSSGNSPPEKSSVATSMLKSTLRKMTRFSMSGKSKKEGEELQGSNNSYPPEHKPKPRTSILPVGTLTSQALSEASKVARSRSFKEPERPGVVRQISGSGSTAATSSTAASRNSLYTSSLRRTKNKAAVGAASAAAAASDTEQSSSGTGQFQRSGTGGHLDRGIGGRRSISATRGGARIIKKSRPVQTNLTRDVAQDMFVEEATDGGGGERVEFQVWLPELLGEACDPVETHITESGESVDVRKNRQLTLDNMKLQREVDRLKAQTTENELLRKELRSVRAKLEQEQTTRANIQKDVESNHERVKGVMAAMEAMEKDWEARADQIHELQIELGGRIEEEQRLREELAASEQLILAQRKELDRSMAAQKTLIQQLQESEAEARELQDFLQAEKSTLADALRDSDGEVRRLKSEIASKDESLSRMDEQSCLLVRRAEQRSQELHTSRAELSSLKERAREMLLAQGAELSRASIAISQLTSRLEQLVPGADQLIDDYDRSESSEEGSSGQGQLDMGLLPRRSSQFLVTPTENLDILSEFSRAMMSASTGSDGLSAGAAVPGGENGVGGLAASSISSLATAIADRQQTEANSNPGWPAVPSLADQIIQADLLLARYLQQASKDEGVVVDTAALSTSNSNSNHFNGNVDDHFFDVEQLDLENVDATRSVIQEQSRLLTQLKSQLEEREKTLTEVQSKFARNRQILTSNWEQAETEVRRLDEVYHETVGQVLSTLESAPEEVQSCPQLSALLNNLQRLVYEEQNSPNGVNGNINQTNNSLNKNGVMSRSLVMVANNSNGSNCFKLPTSATATAMTQSVTNMTHSFLGDSVISSGLKTSGYSEPSLGRFTDSGSCGEMRSLKSPGSGVPSMLTTSAARLSGEDMNANQSL